MVPALVFLVIVAAVSLVFAIVFGSLDKSADGSVKCAAVIGGATSALIVIAFGIWALSLHDTHWDQTCHRMGGKVTESGDCWTGHAVDVP
jgi:heme/copper-type cytochrome/quinol oxidase subunit 4